MIHQAWHECLFSSSIGKNCLSILAHIYSAETHCILKPMFFPRCAHRSHLSACSHELSLQTLNSLLSQQACDAIKVLLSSHEWLCCSFDGNNGVSSSSEAVGTNSASAFSSSQSGPGGSTGTTQTSSDGKHLSRPLSVSVNDLLLQCFLDMLYDIMFPAVAANAVVIFAVDDGALYNTPLSMVITASWLCSALIGRPVMYMLSAWLCLFSHYHVLCSRLVYPCALCSLLQVQIAAASLIVIPAGQGFGLQASNPAGGSAGGVSGQGGKTATGQFVIQTCATTPAVLFAGASPPPSSTGAVAATPGAQAAATAG